MVRVVLYFALVAGIATGAAWFADRPGSLTLDWLGYEVHTSIFVALIVLALFFLAFALAVWLGLLAVSAPRRLSRRFTERRKRLGLEALTRGIFAAGAGDRHAALAAGAIAKKHLPGDPLALLLEAQAAQLNEDSIASRQAFERMLENPEMTELGLRGLHLEAKKAGQGEAAKQFAERALKTNPALAWSSAALFEMQCREGDWRAGLKTLGIAKQYRHVTRVEADRCRAILLTALASELEETQQSKALACAQEAHALDPSLIPAAAIAGRVLAAQGNSARATKLLSQTWRLAPHPEVALIYAHARTGDSPRDRLARVRTLTASAPRNLEGDIAMAVAGIEAQDWDAARAALEPHLSGRPAARVCRLMARIEAGENRDAGRAREWLAKAARGAPDPQWIGPDGSISADWRAVMPASGALGAFEWKVPEGAYASHADEIIAEVTALEAQAIPAGPSLSPSVAGEANLPAPLPTVAAPSAEARDLAAAPAQEKSKPGDGAPIATKTVRPAPAWNAVEAAGRGDDAFAAPLDADVKVFPKVAREKAPEIEIVERPKPPIRKPKIFISGPAPDDPGPRAGDGEDGTTPLSRFRRPS